MSTTNNAQGEWVEWHGGENPAGDEQIDYRLRNGREYRDKWADALEWDHDQSGGDIIAYRLAQPEPLLPGEVLHAETAERTHVPHLEGQAWNQMPKSGVREAKMYRYNGTDLYQWFAKRGVDSNDPNWSVFEDQFSEPFVLRPLSRPQPQSPIDGEVVEVIKALLADMQSPFPMEVRVVASLGMGSSSIERARSLLAKLGAG